MQFKVLSLALLAASVANATPAPVYARGGGRKIATPVCPAGDTPFCCQLDVLGVIDVTCG